MNVYLWKVDNHRVVHHTDLDAAMQLDGLSRQPDMTVPSEEFEAADGRARVIGGRIVIGRTEAEKAEEAETRRIEGIKERLSALDGEALAGRAVREIVLAVADKAGVGGSAVNSLLSIEERAAELRQQLAQ